MKVCKQPLWAVLALFLLAYLTPIAQAKELWLVNGESVEYQGLVVTDDGVMLTMPGGMQEVTWGEINAKSLPPRIRKAHAMEVLAAYDEANIVFADGDLPKAEQMYDALKDKAAYLLDYQETEIWLTAAENIAVIDQMEKEEKKRQIREAKERAEKKKQEFIAKGYVPHEGKWIKKEEKERRERVAFKKKQKGKGLVYEGEQWVKPDEYFGKMISDLDGEWDQLQEKHTELYDGAAARFGAQAKTFATESRMQSEAHAKGSLTRKLTGLLAAVVLGVLAFFVRKLRIPLAVAAVVVLIGFLVLDVKMGKGYSVFRRVENDPFSLDAAGQIGRDYLALAPDGKFAAICEQFVAVNEDVVAFREMLAGNTIDANREYLQKHPEGFGAELAQVRVEYHDANPERYDFQLARVDGARKAYRTFLVKYPDTKYKGLIKYVQDVDN